MSKGNRTSYKGKQGIIKSIIIGLVISTIVTLALNYVWITPWNLTSIACWFKLIVILLIYSVNNCIAVAATAGNITSDDRLGNIAAGPILLPVAAVVIMIVGGITGVQIFHSSDYASIIQVEEMESTDGILSEKDAESIALMDTASATQLGDREIGSIKNFSAFNVADDYVQLNVQNDAVKIAPLEYAGFFKWMKNKAAGVTGYVTVSPTTMTADYVELPEGMQYVPSAYFAKDLNRHIHSQYPTMIYDNTHFEVDEEGNPYYVSSVYKKTIGLFGGEIVTGAIITDPVSGDSTYCDLADVPGWVDDVVEGNLICDLYNVAFKNKNGFWNGTFLGANTGCMQTTTLASADEDEEEDEDSDAASTDFGYIAKDGDIYIYTGVTSMAKDSSNLGFIMVNERTGKYRYFAVSGANEQSAMNAAEGEVQQYSYEASFPTLINVDGELTYIGVLKDSNGLVKMYYMVNVKDYGKVVVASKREECVTSYAKELGLTPDESLIDAAEEGADAQEGESEEEPEENAEEVTFTISVLQYVDVDGNTFVYMGTEDGKVYKAEFASNEDLLFVKTGDTLKGTVSKDNFTLEEVVK